MTGLIGRMDRIEENMNIIAKQFKEESTKKVRKSRFRLPMGFTAKAKRSLKSGKIGVVLLGNNKEIDFKVCPIYGGLIEYGDYKFAAHEVEAVYRYGKKNLPMMVVLESRLSPVGGSTDKQDKDLLVGGKFDITKAKELKMESTAQETILRAIEVAELAKLDDKKKKKKANWIIIIVVAGIAIYALSKLFGG